MAEPPRPRPSVLDEDGDDAVATTTAIKTEEAALSSCILVAAAGPVGEGGPTARGADGRNKRKGRSSPASGDGNTGAASSSANRSGDSIRRGRVKRARRAAADDVVVLETDDHRGGASASTSAARRGAAVLGAGAKVALKAER